MASRWGQLPLLLAILTGGCLAPVGDPVSDAATPVTPSGFPIGPDGGTVRLTGITFEFPPNAVRGLIYVSAEDFDGGPLGYARAGAAITVRPEGQRFDRAVAAVFELTTAPAASAFEVATAPTGTSQFEFLPVVRADTRATAFVWHFSTVQLVVKPDAGSGDAGVTVSDAGPPDAGPPIDAGASGIDAGVCQTVPFDVDAEPGCHCRLDGARCFDASDCASNLCWNTAHHGRVCTTSWKGTCHTCPGCAFDCSETQTGTGPVSVCYPR